MDVDRGIRVAVDTGDVTLGSDNLQLLLLTLLKKFLKMLNIMQIFPKFHP